MKTYNLLIIWILGLFSFEALAQIHREGGNSRYNFVRGGLSVDRTCFDVKYYHLNLTIIPDKKFIQGHNDIHFQVKEPTQRIQIDLYNNLKVEKIIWQGQALKYERWEDFVFIDFPQNLRPSDSLQKISFYYFGKPRTNLSNNGPKGFQWARDGKGNDWVGVSCEHVGASLWWPNKDHLSDEPDSMRLSFTTPSELVCIANGKLERKTEADLPSYTTHHWLLKNPINNYNVSFYLGKYQELKIPYQNTYRQAEISFFYLDRENKKKVEEYTRYIPLFVQTFEYLFGEYPFWNDKFAIVQSSYAGMEHQTCVAIGPYLQTYENWYYYHSVPWHSTLIHEIAHEWWGNNVSVADMADVWLHEGFATYCEFLFMETIYGKNHYEREMTNLSRFVANQYKIVGRPNINDNTFIDGDIYFKGAITLHELREAIKDDSKFFRILQSFQMKFRGKTVKTQDFIDQVNLVTGKDFNDFFKKRVF
ncbi:MAG: M1 family metallopeptidase [Microscillaceae bacterium]|jgi:aminopeptidase N|nr:M1 family metallopeptidase [Microscillaceae bacterium]